MLKVKEQVWDVQLEYYLTKARDVIGEVSAREKNIAYTRKSANNTLHSTAQMPYKIYSPVRHRIIVKLETEFMNVVKTRHLACQGSILCKTTTTMHDFSTL